MPRKRKQIKSPAKQSADYRRWRLRHKEKVSERNKKYREANPDYWRNYKIKKSDREKTNGRS